MDEHSLTLEECQAKCEEYLAGWKRAQADYQNLKRDNERDRQEFAKYANERLCRELLPAIDQFDLVLRFLPDTTSFPEDARKTWENWLVGVKAVKSFWDQVAQQIGLEMIPTQGIFDPQWHDAGGEEEAEGKQSGEIIRVIQTGWRLHGKVLQPAKVIVAK